MHPTHRRQNKGSANVIAYRSSAARLATAVFLASGLLTPSWAAPAMAETPAVTAAASAAAPPAQSPVTAAPDAAQAGAAQASADAAEVDALVGVVTSAREDAAARRRAAETLLSGKSDRAVEALAGLLAPDAAAAPRQVVLAAIADGAGDPPPALSSPLLKLLAATEGAAQREVAAAMGRFHDRTTIRRVIEHARDESAAASRRAGAALVLGYHRSQGACLTLIEMTQPAQPAGVRSAAFTALSNLTGISEFGEDAAQWARWWDEHRQLSEGDWLSSLLENYKRRAEKTGSEANAVRDRLVESQRQLYRTLPQEDRQARLVSMLGDTYEPLRRLAVELTSEFVLQRQSQNQPVGAELRAALLARLSDASPAVRQGAARRLGELDDAAGADAVVAKLAKGEESDRDVLRAYLSLMARVPRAKAVQPAITLLGDQALRRDAASVLTKAIDSGLVGADVRPTVLGRVRAAASNAKTPEPELIELLGRLAEEQDWKQMTAWLDNSDAGVRGAAAKAWGASNRPLAELAKWAGDADVLPRFIEASSKRGADAATLAALIKHKPERPDQEQLALAWQRAVTAVASRVPPHVVLDADKRLDLRGGSAVLREQVLSGAIAKLSPNGTTQPAADTDTYIDLLIARGEVRLLQGDPAQAIVDLRRVASSQPAITGERLNRCDLAMFRATLSAGLFDEAFDLAKRLFAVEPPEGDRVRTVVTQTLLEASQRSLKAGQADPARRMLKTLREIAGGSLSKENDEKASQLERGVEQLSPTVTAVKTPTTMPADARP